MVYDYNSTTEQEVSYPMAWQFSSRAPVYMQIVSRIRADILNGVYRADEQIPAVRQLAFEAGVNPNTMQRAFAVLEAENLFVTRGTIGRFITSDSAVLDHAREVMRREAVEQILADARAVGMEPAELIDRIHTYIRDTETEAEHPTENADGAPPVEEDPHP